MAWSYEIRIHYFNYFTRLSPSGTSIAHEEHGTEHNSRLRRQLTVDEKIRDQGQPGAIRM